MSRVADAFRKSRRAADAAPGRALAGDRELDAWMSVPLPWDLHDSPSAPGASGGAAPGARSGQPTDVCGRADLASPGDLSGLVQRVLQHGDEDLPIRSVLFTPVDADVSSALVCVGTAVELTVQRVATVCVIDGNLRPTLTAALGVPETRGLSDVLSAREDLRGCLVPVAANVWVLPRGLRCDEMSARITAEQMRVHLRDCLSMFDYVLIDSAPAAAHGDAALLGTVVDAAVLVVDATSTRREAARQAVRHLRSVRVNVVGAVLTNRTFPIPDAIYRKL